MKKITVIALLLCVCTLGMAQTEKPSTVNISKGTSSLAAFVSICKNSAIKNPTGIMYNYYLNDGLSLRGNLRVGYSNDKVKDNSSWTSNNELGIAAGIQKSLFTSRMWDGHVGLTALAGGYSTTYHYSNDSKAKQSTFEWGFRPYMGLDHYVVKSLYVGFEWGYDLTFTSKKNDGVKTQANNFLNIVDLSSATFKIGYCF